MERAAGFEPACGTWKDPILPLDDAREVWSAQDHSKIQPRDYRSRALPLELWAGWCRGSPASVLCSLGGWCREQDSNLRRFLFVREAVSTTHTIPALLWRAELGSNQRPRPSDDRALFN